MTIRPVEFNGMMQRSQDVSTVKHAENQKGAVMQHQIEHRQQEKDIHKLKQVHKSDKKDETSGKYDARDEGKNKYFASKENKKQPKKTGDTVIQKGKTSSFDIKI